MSDTDEKIRDSRSVVKLAPRGTPAGFYDPEAEAPFFIWIGLASVVTGVVVMLASKPIHRLMAGVDRSP